MEGDLTLTIDGYLSAARFTRNRGLIERGRALEVLMSDRSIEFEVCKLCAGASVQQRSEFISKQFP